MNTISEEAAMKHITACCARSECSKADAYDKLRKWGVAHKAIEKILAALESGGFIDEERFCRSFVHDKFYLSKWGRMKIVQALSIKRIPSEMVYRHLNEIDEEEYAGVLLNLLRTKMRSVKEQPWQDIEVKLMRFAASRGFEMRYIKRCLNEIAKEKKLE